MPQSGVEVLPKDLLLFIRVTQMLRGLGAAVEGHQAGGGGGAGSVPTLARACVEAPREAGLPCLKARHAAAAAAPRQQNYLLFRDLRVGC
jgi:hypothetical protein